MRRSKYNNFEKLPWIEKHRPTKVSQILLNDYVRNEITKIINEKENLNIIITGKPGIGKTSTIKCLANELYGKYYDQYVLELNASDDRGIKIESIISFFCKSLLNIPSFDKKNYPLYKWVILDEADNITEKAQHIISKLMNQYKDVVKFAFTCNTSYNIIESIQSRCNKILRYDQVDFNKIIMRLQDICDYEKVSYEIKGLEYIAELCNGDVRSALNILELTYRKHSYISEENILDIYDKPHRKILYNIIQLCIKHDHVNALKEIFNLKNKGYTGSDIITEMFNILKSKICNNIDEDIKISLYPHMSYYLYIIKDLDSDLQLISFIYSLCDNN